MQLWIEKFHSTNISSRLVVGELEKQYLRVVGGGAGVGLLNLFEVGLKKLSEVQIREKEKN
jgi:hypothetical protein